jgi:hypothetical protein
VVFLIAFGVLAISVVVPEITTVGPAHAGVNLRDVECRARRANALSKPGL